MRLLLVTAGNLEPRLISGEKGRHMAARKKAPQGAESAALAVRLNLSGGAIAESRADAEAIGKFIAHIAEATKAISNAVAESRYEDSRDNNGRATKRKVKVQPLQLEGAVETGHDGAVQLTFRAPDAQPASKMTGGVEEHLPLEDLAEDTIESEALRTIFSAFTFASSHDSIDAEELVETFETPTAREAVRRAVTVLHHNGWEMTGEAQQANHAPDAITFNARGQARLADALKADLIGKYQARLRGTIDGHKNSNNTIYFRPKNASTSWSMTAATDALYLAAARTSLDAQNQVDLTIEFEPKTDREGNPTDRIVRRIIALDNVAEKEMTEPLF